MCLILCLINIGSDRESLSKQLGPSQTWKSVSPTPSAQCSDPYLLSLVDKHSASSLLPIEQGGSNQQQLCLSILVYVNTTQLTTEIRANLQGEEDV